MAAEMQYLIHLAVDGYPEVLKFDKLTGGDSNAVPQKHREGGMGAERVYPALPVYTNVTLSRVYDNGQYRNDHVIIGTLRDKFSGKAMCTVTEQPLDANGHAFGTPRTFRGMLGDIKDGIADSTSETPREWEADVVVVTSRG